MKTMIFYLIILCSLTSCNLKGVLVESDEDISWRLIGKVAPRHAKEINSSNWSIGAEMMDRDWTIYKNWKSYLGPLGAKKARIQSGWAKTEIGKGEYNWVWLDEIIQDMTVQGVKPWVSLSYGNPLYSGGGGTSLNAAVPTSNEAIRAWKRYVRSCVSRYSNYVNEWEVWNEPNYKVPASNYANLFIETAQVIRDTQPNATIIAFAIGSGVDYKYVDEVMEILRLNGKIHLVDQVTYHRHIFIPEKNEAEIELQKIVAKYDSRIKVRQGEAGCPSQLNKEYALNNYEWTESIQAKHIARRLLTDLGRDIESSCFTIMESYNSKEWNHKGLLKANPDFTVAYAKLAYYTFQNITSIFDDNLKRIKDYEWEITNIDRSIISLYAYRNDKGDQIITMWLNNMIPSENNKKSFVDLNIYQSQFKEPVLIDIVTGCVYKIPGTKWKSEKQNMKFHQIPIFDSPILIAEKSILKIDTIAE